MDVRELAAYLNMSVTWTYRHARELGIASYKFGSGRNAKIQFRVSEVKVWVEQQKSATLE
ncbi:helix-turn-helix domain-containing protein [Streptomyces sp. NBC_00690]|uniref:helix-turn-helix domain-containing protein n=1 Tax=Streptomyces sp. NBC_00690 TaxID=2975808 RepID=UPI003FA6DADD